MDEYLRHRTRSNTVKARYISCNNLRCTCRTDTDSCYYNYRNSAIRIQSIHRFYIYVHTWMVHQATAFSLWPCQVIKMKCLNFKFCSLYLKRLISGNPTIKRFFSLFQHFTFTVWLLCLLKLFHFGEGRNMTIEAFDPRPPKGGWLQPPCVFFVTTFCGIWKLPNGCMQSILTL